MSDTPRHASLRLHITDARASRDYIVVPIRPAPESDDVCAFRLLFRLGIDAPPVIYTVTLARSGRVRCTCPGHISHKHCKHADALQALHLIDSEERDAATRARFQADQARNEAEQAAASAKRDRAEAAKLLHELRLIVMMPRARRLHRPAVPAVA